jgi:hypothetical protein
MARKKPESTSSPEEPQTPSAEERNRKRTHHDHGNVRPADGRWDLHDPKDESKHVQGNTGG